MNRRAFSMIEILIAIVVLSIGLLGLAISLPATISIQRRGADATRAVTAASAAKAYIETRPDLNRLHTWEVAVGIEYPPRQPVGLGTLVDDRDWSPTRRQASRRYAWDNTRSGKIEVYGDDAGRMDFFIPASSENVYINVGDRLWPAPSTGMRPEFVWDFVARRLPSRKAAALGSPRIQVALFVRRIDPGIRTKNATLYQVLTGRPTPVPPSDRRVPVAVRDNDIDVLPRMNGQGDYARLFMLDVEYDPEDPDQIRIMANNPSKLDVATRPGQRFVDNLGNVYRVLRSIEVNSNNIVVVVDPPVPSWVQRTTVTPQSYELFQIVLTPQTPVTIEVFDLTLTDPVGSPSGSGVGGRYPR
ncbi:MAG: prepilin-type N-terminal cleavage/methylation domain-containing protein [Planctomycetes bacterium]|nr:prepilin-type N-terminal cleavage/methylation domain-containing protein [Planctomycetota bacterium]